MPRPLSVHLLPSLFEPDHLSGGIAVVVDILRASTTISHALANGAACVVPCGTVEQALQIRDQHSSGACLLGGERGGVKIDGFDLSNSPADYGPAVVTDKVIGFTTTNGTTALLRSVHADAVLIGAFVNLTRMTERLLTDDRAVHIVCAGTNGEITGEDILFAGALANGLRQSRNSEFEMSDAARIARNHWLAECGDGSCEALETALRRSRGGRNLIKLGYDEDIATAAAIDSVSVTGRLTTDGSIKAGSFHDVA